MICNEPKRTISDIRWDQACPLRWPCAVNPLRGVVRRRKVVPAKLSGGRVNEGDRLNTESFTTDWKLAEIIELFIEAFLFTPFPNDSIA